MQENCNTETRSVNLTALIFVRGLREAVRQILAPCNIRMVMKPTFFKRSLMRGVKRHDPVEETAGVIHAFACIEGLQVYIVEPACTAKQRVLKQTLPTQR